VDAQCEERIHTHTGGGEKAMGEKIRFPYFLILSTDTSSWIHRSPSCRKLISESLEFSGKFGALDM
jgi:hypothetical protein